MNFALFSALATRVELCLFGDDDKKEHRIALPEMTQEIWHGYLPDLRPGQLYGYRVHGPYEPDAGKRFNANKLLIDPYAKALKGEMDVADWQNPIAKAIALLLSGEAGLTYLTEKGEPELDDTFVMILNASHVDVEVTLPERPTDRRWQVEINTSAEDGLGHTTCEVGAPFDSIARSFVLLRGTTTPAI